MTLCPRKASNTFTPAQRSKLDSVKLVYMMFLPQDEGLDIYVKETLNTGSITLCILCWDFEKAKLISVQGLIINMCG